MQPASALVGLALLGTALGGVIDADILRILASSQSNGYYVLSPVHFLPASSLGGNFLPFPAHNQEKEKQEQPATIDDGELTPPDEEYGPPNKDSDSDSVSPPRKEYGPPKDEYGPPKKEYLPPPPKEAPKEEYGPPKNDYLPPKADPTPGPAPQASVIFKSYVEPTYTFGEIPLLAYAHSGAEAAAPKEQTASKEGY